MSELERAIARARRDLARDEAQARAAMRRAYRLAVERIETELAIVARQLAGTPLPASWFDARGRFTPTGELLFRQQRLRQLLPLAEAEFARFRDSGLRIVTDVQARAVSGGALTAVELAGAAGITTAFAARINVPAVERLIGALSPGSPLRAVLDGYGARGAEVIERLLVQGLATGEGPRQTARRIVAELDSPGTMARLDALVRTEMMRAFEGSLFDQYAAMGVERWVWMAALSSRTCLACLAMHGSVHPMSRPFLRRHVRCRCIPAPYTSDVTVERGADWFARQSEATHRQMLPSAAAYEAYRAGTLTLDDFVGMRRSRVWGTSIRERSGREALGRVA